MRIAGLEARDPEDMSATSARSLLRALWRVPMSDSTIFIAAR